MNRADIAGQIASRLSHGATFYSGYFYVDDLLPEGIAKSIYAAFPDPSALMLRKTIRERKYVTSQMDRCNALLEECVYAFQDPRVVQAIASITGLEALEPDEKLYAGGISVMGEGHFLHPHLDNSHDMDRQRYRVLNLLYYTSPDWPDDVGGNLELWPNGFTEPCAIHAKFNRLLVIATNRSSWHSVSKIRTRRLRTCVSNYYFSPVSPEGLEYSHVTSFRGRPGQPFIDLALRADSAARATVRRFVKRGITKHYYAKS